MPTKRMKRTRNRRFAELPDFVLWWLKTGGILDTDECRTAGFDNPSNAAWGLFVLHYGDEPAGAGGRVWTRGRLREAGYGVEVDLVEERHRAEAAEAAPDAA